MRRLLVLAPLLLVTACGSADVTIGSDDAPAKATPEALVAVALSHLTPEPDDLELYRADEPVDDAGTLSPWIGGMLRWKPDPDWTLSLRVQPLPEESHLCDADRTCAGLDEARISWQPAGEDQPGYVTVYVERDGQLRSVGYEGGFEGDPRDDDLAVDLHELADIVTDPAFALTTTPSAALRACPPTLHCESWDPGKTFAWRADLAGSVRSDEQRSVHVWVDGPPIKAATKDWLFPGGEPKPAQLEASAALADLPDDPAMGWKTTEELIAAGEGITWFHD